MGDVYDRHGRRVGWVNAWSGVYNALGIKVGSIDIFSNKVYNASGQFVGSADIYGNVYNASGRFFCKVPFWGFKVKDAHGHIIGSVGIAGAPEPMPDMQWRGAAALLLLCTELNKPDLEQIALEYLLDRTSSSRSELIKAGRQAVTPLLKALTKYLAAHGNEIKSKHDRQSIKDRYWAEKIMNPHVRPAHEIILALGSPGIDGLFDALQETDRWVQKAASVFLTLTDHVPDIIIDKVRKHIRAGRVDDTTSVTLLMFVLAQGNDDQSQKAIASYCQEYKQSPGDFLLEVINTAILELLGWEPGISVKFEDG